MNICSTHSTENVSAATLAGHPAMHSSYERLKSEIAATHPSTAEHSVKVRICATSLGLAFGLTGSDLTTLAIAAEIHDIGKIRIPKQLLDKPGKLTESDWHIIKKHVIWSAQMAAEAFPERPEVAKCVLAHHERLDGSGYPYGLRDNQISVLPRILSVADAFVALTENRAYRRAIDKVAALKIMAEDEKGKYSESILGILARSI